MESRMVPQNPAYEKMRRWPRFLVELPVRVYCDLPCSVHEGKGTGLNAGGMAVHTTIDLRVGDQISVEFTPPEGQQPVRARCLVRNRNGQTYGIEFVAENDADYRTIGQIEYDLGRFAATLQGSVSESRGVILPLSWACFR